MDHPPSDSDLICVHSGNGALSSGDLYAHIPLGEAQAHPAGLASLAICPDSSC